MAFLAHNTTQHFLRAFLAMLLLVAPALAAEGLHADKTEIVVGESTTVRLDGVTGMFKTRWKASPDGIVRFDRKDNTEASVTGLKAGVASISAKVLASSYSLDIKVLEAPDKKDPKAAQVETLVRALGVPDVQTRIARLLFEVTNEIRSAESFYVELRKIGGKMTDVIEVRTKLVDMPDLSLARQVMGPGYPEGGTLVEQRILTWRKQQTLEAINTVLAKFAGRAPADGVQLMVSHVGKWANEDSRSLKFPGDIDFSFVSTDEALVRELKAEFLEEIVRRTQLDQFSLDAVATAHGKAGLEVYIGRHGMAFAEQQMKINFIVDLEKGTRKPAGIEEVTQILATERTMLAARGKEITQPEWNTEPGLSMEMVRHFDHDIVKTSIYDVTNAVVKAAKYLDRSYESLRNAKGTPADPKLAEFAKDITALANAKPQSVASRESAVKRISDYFGSPPKVEFDEGTQTLRLSLDAGQIAAFHKTATEAMWKTVEQGSKIRTEDIDTRLRDLLDRQRRGENVDEDVSKLRQDMVALIDMVEAEIKAIHGDMKIPVTVLTNNANVRGLMDALSQRFGTKALSADELKDKKFVEELLKAQVEHPNRTRAEMIKAYVMDRAARAAEVSMKGVEKTNQYLDIFDDTLLGSLRGDAEFADFEAEMKNIRAAAADPKSKQAAAGRLAVLKGKVANGIKASNQFLNQSLQATSAGRQGMKFMAVYGLVDEMQAYRDVFSEQGWEGFATEFFRRRVPLGSAVENVIMGNTYLATWDVITTLVPPLGLYDAAKGLGTSIGSTAKSTYWSEQLALFVDTLYDGAKFKLQAMETEGTAKIGVYRLVSIKHPDGGDVIDLSVFANQRQKQVEDLNQQLKTPRYKGGGIDWSAYKATFNGLTEWTEVDATLKNNLVASDPVLTLLEKMASHESVGPRLMEGLAEKGLVRWEEVKLGFITNLIKRLEDRKQADQALGAGMLPDMFLELRKAAAALEIEDAMLRALDTEVDTNNLKALVNWLWETKRNVLAQAPTESETTRAAQVVKKYLDTYKGIVKSRDELAASLPAVAAKDGSTRYLTGDLFLSGRADADKEASAAWVKHVGASLTASSEALLAIKKEYLPNLALDAEDEKYLARVFPRELWMKPYKDAGVARGKTWLLDRAIAHGKARNEILDEYKAWLEKQAPVQLTVTLLDALDGKRQVSGASGDLRPTDVLGKPGTGKAGGNQLVFGVPSGRYRLGIKAPGYEDASQDVLLGRALNPKPMISVNLTPTGKKDDGDLAQFITAALKARDWKRLAERLDAEKKSDLKMRNAVAWQANIDALGEALQTLKGERMAWALAWKDYMEALDNIDSRTWDKLTRAVDSKRDEYEAKCNDSASASEDPRKRQARCQKEASKFYDNCLGEQPKQHYEERQRIRTAMEQLPDQVQTLHSAGYFTHKAWFEAVEKMADKYKLPYPYPNPVTPRLKYAASCATVDLPKDSKKPDEPAAFAVTIQAPTAPVPYGKALTLIATAGGGKAPHSFAWSSGGSGARVSMTPRWAGEWTVTVTATDAAGKIGAGSATLIVSPMRVKLTGTKPQVFYGGQATLTLPGKEPPPPASALAPDPCAGHVRSNNPFDECNEIKVDKRVSVALPPGAKPSLPELPPSDVNQVKALPETSPTGKERVLWQASPAVIFNPRESDNGSTQVTYSRMGEVKLWCDIQRFEEGAFHTVGECDQETVTVIAPKFSMSFVPAAGQGRIGQDIRARIDSQPGVIDKLIDFRWFEPPTANRLESPPNAREIGFKVKDAKPVVLKVLARVPGDGDEIAEIAATYTGLMFEVKAWVMEPGNRPMMWEPKKGGLVPVPKGQYATHERIPLRAEIQGGTPPDDLRWNWTVNDGTTISNPISQTPTVSRSEPGGISARVTVRDKDGAELGSAEVSASVIEVSSQPPTSANPTVSLSTDHGELERGQTAWINADASGGKPPYTYAWQGEKGQGARVSVTPAKIGPYTVGVSVTDAKGKTATANLTVNVLANPRDRSRDQAGKLVEQARGQAKSGDLEGAAKSVENARRLDAEVAKPVAREIHDLARQEAQSAEQKRDFDRSRRMFEAAKLADPGDLDALRGVTNAPIYQKRVDEVQAWQREVEELIVRGAWQPASERLADIKRWEETLPGPLSRESQTLIERHRVGFQNYQKDMEIQRKSATDDYREGRLSQARAKVTALQQRELTSDDRAWAKALLEAIAQKEQDTAAGKSQKGAAAAPLGTFETTPGLYRIEVSGSEARIAKQKSSPGGLQHAGLVLQTESLGGPVSGDFEAEVGFRDARIEGGINQIELQASFADGGIFFVVRDREGGGSHIWAPGLQGNATCGRDGVLRMQRRGETLTGYCNGTAIWSTMRKAPLTRLQFVLQNNGSDDPISVTFSNWRFSAPAATGVGMSGTSGLAGTWNINANNYTGKMEITESAGQLAGRVWFDAHQQWENLQDIGFDGRTLRFLRPGPSQRYTGTLSGNEVRGTFSGGGSYPWSATRVGVAAPLRGVQIADLVWHGMDEDRVGDWGNGKPNGVKDGHFRLTLDLPARATLASISLWSANERGDKAGGQIWHTQNGNNWMLGVFRDGRQLNTSHVASLGEFQGRTVLDLYANSSGWFNPGQWFLVEVADADGKVTSRAVKLDTGGIGSPASSDGAIVNPSGGRDYTYSTPPDRDSTAAPPGPPARSAILFDNGNTGGVDNGPSQPTTFSLAAPHVITLIQNYHWNFARGAAPGSIGLRDASGRNFGPWPAEGSPGQGGVPNANWTVRPMATLPMGSYTVVDSNAATWARNAGSQQRGFSRVEAYPAGRSEASSTDSQPAIMEQIDSLKDAWKGLKGLLK